MLKRSRKSYLQERNKQKIIIKSDTYKNRCTEVFFLVRKISYFLLGIVFFFSITFWIFLWFEILASKVYEYHQRESGGGEDARESDSDIMRARSSSLAPRFLHARARVARVPVGAGERVFEKNRRWFWTRMTNRFLSMLSNQDFKKKNKTNNKRNFRN